MTEKNCCAFTGHRQIESDFDRQLLAEKIREVSAVGVDTFYCGMAMGFDLIAAEEIIKLKQENPKIKLVACVPCGGQEKYYSAEEKRKYADILKCCDSVNVLSERYFRGCMIVRDRYMADHCGYVIAYVRKGGKSGTAYTVNYARSLGRTIILI